VYSSVGVATRLQNIRSGVRISAGTRDVSLHKYPDQLWNPPSVSVSGYWGWFSGIKRPNRDFDHLFQLETRLRTSGAILLLPHMSLWRWQRKFFMLCLTTLPATKG